MGRCELVGLSSRQTIEREAQQPSGVRLHNEQTKMVSLEGASKRTKAGDAHLHRVRVALTLVVAIASGYWTYHIRAGHPTITSDLTPVVLGARLWLQGQDPYAIVGHTAQWPVPLVYPFPAILLTLPFAT